MTLQELYYDRQFAGRYTDLFGKAAQLMQGKSPEEIIALMKDPLFRKIAKAYEKKRQRRTEGELQR